MTLQSIQPLALSAGTLKGDRVLNLKDETIGTVEEIMIDINTGRVAYVVLSFGGILGIGDKLFAIPWSALEIDIERRVFLIDVDKELLERAPGFDKNNWPETPNGQWYHEVYGFYGEEAYWLQS